MSKSFASFQSDLWNVTFNTGKAETADTVVCFECGIKSGNWSTGEDPWERHARSSRSCQYLLSELGPLRVNQIIEEFGEYTPPPRQDTVTVSA